MTNLLTTVLIIKEHMKKIYAGYSTYIDKIFKLTFAMVTIGLINKNLGFFSVMKNPLIMVVLALICAFLPIHFLVIVSAVLVLIHLYAVSLELMAAVFLVMMLIFILYIRFVPQEAIVLLLTPVAFGLKIPYLIPLAMGLIGTPLSAVSVGSGVFIYFIVALMAEYGPVIMSAADESSSYNLSFFIEKIFQDKLVLLTAFTFIFMVCIVYLIKRLSVDYAWTIAVVAGAISNILLMLIGDFALDLSNSYVVIFGGTIVSAVLAWILQVFIFSVDYTRTEHVQFEDDEYYYYVKAVPKVSMAVENKQVKRINRRKYMSFKRKPEAEEEVGMETRSLDDDFLKDQGDEF